MIDYASQMNAEWDREQKELADLEDKRQKFLREEVKRIQEDPEEVGELVLDHFEDFRPLFSNLAKPEFDQDVAYEIHLELKRLIERLAWYRAEDVI